MFALDLLYKLIRPKPISGYLPDPDDDATPAPIEAAPPALLVAPKPAAPPPPAEPAPQSAPRPRGPRSPLARQVTGVRDPAKATPRDPWGLLIHTTGGGVPAKAKRTGRSPASVAIDVYIASQNGSNGYLWGGPHYVLDHDGQLYQIAPDDVVMHHAGGPDRADYLSGAWTKRCSAAMVAAWRAAWPGKRSPAHLYPSRSPNTDFVGVEIVPIGSGLGGELGGEPMAKGLRFTRPQHEAVATLAIDCAARHGWPKGWHRTSRLLSHEDVQPIRRHDRGGGWDIGWLRAAPYFDLEFVRALIDKSEQA